MLNTHTGYQLKILVPLDGTRSDNIVLQYLDKSLSQMFLGARVEILLLQALSFPSIVEGHYDSSIIFTDKQIDDDMRKTNIYLKKMAQLLENKAEKISIKVMCDNVCKAIIETAEEINADMIIISTNIKYISFLWFSGYAVYKIIQSKLKIPIVVIKV